MGVCCQGVPKVAALTWWTPLSAHAAGTRLLCLGMCCTLGQAIKQLCVALRALFAAGTRQHCWGLS
jgi:hypothetical protein